MEIKYKISQRAQEFLQKHLPEALQAENSFQALKMLYELIDAEGFQAPKYVELNEFGEEADEIYDEIYEMNMEG